MSGTTTTTTTTVTRLPVYAARTEILKKLKENQVIILVGETGCGKTTQIPQFIVDNEEKIWNDDHPIHSSNRLLVGVSQPRRVAAITVAKRVAFERSCTLGGEVGYCVRFEDVTSKSETRIKFVTDGMLLREAISDPLLRKYRVLILDEAHERSLRTDILFGIVIRALEMRKDSLKCLVMSATLDIDLFTDYFQKYSTQIIRIPGRQFPVQILYTETIENDRVDAAVIATLQVHLREPKDGDILVFLTGQDEIEACEEILIEKAKKLPSDALKLIVCTLFASLSSEQQMLSFEKAPPNARKVILATNIAETSVTVSGVKYVIDGGAVKTRQYHPKTGLHSLDIVPISQAQAWQRSGRAGREFPGKCFRLYTESMFLEKFPERAVSEIKRVDLSEVVLHLLALGIEDVTTFQFLEPPKIEGIKAAFQNLIQLGAVKNGVLTELGKGMSALPLDPVHSYLLLSSSGEFNNQQQQQQQEEEKQQPCLAEMLAIVAMMSVEPPFFHPRKGDPVSEKVCAHARKKYVSTEGDHLTLLNIFTLFESECEANETVNHLTNWANDHFLKLRTLMKARKVRDQLADILSQTLKISIPKLDLSITDLSKKHFSIIKCLVQCFGASKIAYRQSLPSSQQQHNGKESMSSKYITCISNTEVSIHPSCSLFSRHASVLPEYVVFDEIIMTSRHYIRGVTQVPKSLMVSFAPKFVVTHTHPTTPTTVNLSWQQQQQQQQNRRAPKRSIMIEARPER